MARDARFLHADTMIAAIYQASSLLTEPIERVEAVGPVIHVEAGGRRIVFRASQSQTFDPEIGTAMLGGTSGDVVFVSESYSPTPWGVLKSLLGKAPKVR